MSRQIHEARPNVVLHFKGGKRLEIKESNKGERTRRKNRHWNETGPRERSRFVRERKIWGIGSQFTLGKVGEFRRKRSSRRT